MRELYLMTILVIISASVFAQNATLRGSVFDQKTQEPLIGVAVVADNGTGTVTDLEGSYILELEPGDYVITYSYIGYKSFTKSVTLKPNQVESIDVDITEETEELDIVVVSGSRYAKKITEETMTIDVVQSELLENTNVVDAAEAVGKVPGVTVIDGQASIRGGSGFSYGVGTRVLMMVDGLPLLDGILSDVRWKFIPLENAEQIEVIKGPASVLYGSSALNGTMNVVTGWPTNEPRTKISFFTQIYDSPNKQYRQWWEDQSPPFGTGINFSHQQRFGNFDLITGGNVNLLRSYLEDGDEMRFRGNFKTRYRPPNKRGLSFGLNGNIMYEQSGRFFLWQNADSNAFEMFQGGNDQYLLMTFDPHVTYFNERGSNHQLRSRYYRTFRFGSTSGESPPAVANQIFADYQYRKKWMKGVTFTTGGTVNSSFNTTNLFDGRNVTAYGGVYSQVEYNYKRLTFLGGLRVELNHVYRKDSVGVLERTENSPPVFRTGMNLHIGKATYFRASWGMGYRFPSPGELFINDNISVLFIVPNWDLQSETGWNLEFGLKQGLKFGKWLGYFDFSVYWMQFQDFIEFRIVPRPDFLPPSGEIAVYFQPDNVSDARIAGYEASIMGEGKIGPVKLRTLTGYTYSYPGDLEGDSTQRNVGTFIKNFFKGMGGIGFDDPERSSILRYRNMHTVRSDIELTYKRFSFGYTVTYNSFMINFDEILRVFDLDTFIEQRKDRRGDLIMDTRVAVDVGKKSKLSFIIKNVSNIDYALRPGIMNAPRSFTLQYRIRL